MEENLNQMPQISETPLPSPEEGEAKKLAKFLVPLVVAVLIIAYLAAASAYSIWPFGEAEPQNQEPSTSSGINSSLSEVEGWQTYRKQEFGFEVKYPSAFVERGKTDKSLSLANSIECAEDANKGEEGYGAPQGCQLITFWAYNNKIIEDELGVTHEQTNVNGIPWEITYNNGKYVEDAGLKAQFERNGQWYMVSLNFHPNDTGKSIALFNQILSIFKFIK